MVSCTNMYISDNIIQCIPELRLIFLNLLFQQLATCPWEYCRLLKLFTRVLNTHRSPVPFGIRINFVMLHQLSDEQTAHGKGTSCSLLSNSLCVQKIPDFAGREILHNHNCWDSQLKNKRFSILTNFHLQFLQAHVIPLSDHNNHTQRCQFLLPGQWHCLSHFYEFKFMQHDKQWHGISIMH